jgi:methylase of polypeptide subunit release factors
VRIEDSQYVKEHLDGYGNYLKQPFVDAVRHLDRKFASAFEWCSGIGVIGMELLRQNLCERLCLADINPRAIEIAREIAARDELQDRIDFFVSDNMVAVPNTFRFDLVVSNPPNYFNVQKENPWGALLFNDLRPNDRGWQIHRRFYSTIRPYLLPDAVLLIQEVEPYKTEVYIRHTSPYDIREEPPIETFQRMTEENGLKIVETRPFVETPGVSMYLLKIIPTV